MTSIPTLGAALADNARREYLAVTGYTNGVGFEETALSVGREFLPPNARRVLDGERLSGAEAVEYYSWLTWQYEQASDEASEE